MKKIYIALFSAALILSSCVEQMEEVESTQFAGIWAVVDEYDMASKYYVFDKGYFTEYKSDKAYYIHEDIIWGVLSSPDNYGTRYKYSVEDGILHYSNYFNDVQVPLMRQGNELMMGDKKCCLIKEVSKSYYSEIILSESNKTQFLDDDKSIEWDFQIVNPLYEYELEVVQTPQWCSDVSVEDGKICFKVESGVETRTGNFVLYYPTAGERVVEVKRGDVDILVEDTFASFQHTSGYGRFDFVVKNARKGVSPVAYTSAGWIKSLRVNNNSILFNVEWNGERDPRSAEITLSYDDIIVEFEVIQSSYNDYGFWIGEWTVKGMNGLEQKIRITERVNRSSYYMTGYGGLSDEFAAVLVWNWGNYQWELKNQIIGYRDLGDGNVGEVWMYGGGGSGFKAPEKDISICFCMRGTSTAHRLISPTASVDFISLAQVCNGEWSELSSSDYPTFPITITWAGD